MIEETLAPAADHHHRPPGRDQGLRCLPAERRHQLGRRHPPGGHDPLHRALHRHLRRRPGALHRRRAVPAHLVGPALPYGPPRPQAGGVNPSHPLRHPRRMATLRPTPTQWRADEPSPHRHRQLLRPHPGRADRPRHRGRAADHPLRRRGVRRPRAARASRTSTPRWPRPTCCPRPPPLARALRARRSAAAADAGADAVVCINLSGDLSATDAVRPARRPKAFEGELDVRVVDCRRSPAGLGTHGARRGRGRRRRRPTPTPSSQLVDLDGRPHRDLRRPRHPRQPQEGRPHRRRPGPARLDALDQADHPHLRRRGRGGRQAAHPRQGARVAARQAVRGGRGRAALRAARRGPRHRRVPRPDRPAVPAGVDPPGQDRRRSSAPTAAPA